MRICYIVREVDIPKKTCRKILDKTGRLGGKAQVLLPKSLRDKMPCPYLSVFESILLVKNHVNNDAMADVYA